MVVTGLRSIGPVPSYLKGDDPCAVEGQPRGVGREVAEMPAAHEGYEVLAVPVAGHEAPVVDAYARLRIDAPSLAERYGGVAVLVVPHHAAAEIEIGVEGKFLE